MSALVVGSVALDTVITPFGRADDVLGGSASFFSVAARLFTPVNLVAVVGDDFPKEHIAMFQARGIDTTGLTVTKGRTFRWAGEYGFDLNSRETLDTQLNVFADFDPVIPMAYRQPRFLFLANIDPGLQRRVLDQVERPEVVLMDTMNFWIERSRESLMETLRRVDLVFLNDGETRELTGESNLIKAARAVLTMGPSIVVVKKGEHGSILFTRDFTFSAPAYPIERLFDPTGAGDTFAGGFVGHLASCKDVTEAELRRAVVTGTVMASFAVESFSLDRLAGATKEEVADRIREIKQLSDFVPA
ncbi:MAG: PfkB family carbohydrate kinase [Candidatus Eisenbacteria bacterium]|nr:PfkB family carbohydrate kinase [Candidatus Eisenbacteria bacterium]